MDEGKLKTQLPSKTERHSADGKCWIVLFIGKGMSGTAVIFGLTLNLASMPQHVKGVGGHLGVGLYVYKFVRFDGNFGWLDMYTLRMTYQKETSSWVLPICKNVIPYRSLICLCRMIIV